MVSQVIFFISYPVQAETADDYSSTMSREKFERAINRQFQYINKRLLNNAYASLQKINDFLSEAMRISPFQRSSRKENY